MHWEIFLFVLFACYQVVITSKAKLNALWNLEGMTICSLGYPATIYNDYGCWCGVGGSGKPMDGIDRCCLIHDLCYDDAIRSGLCYATVEEYVYPYGWICNSSQPICDESTGCGGALCKCDCELVKCWSRFEKPKIRAKCVKMNDTKYHFPEIPRLSWLFNKMMDTLEEFVMYVYRKLFTKE